MNKIHSNNQYNYNNIKFKGHADLKNSVQNLKSKVEEIQSDNNKVTKLEMVAGTGTGLGALTAFSMYTKNAAEGTNAVKKLANNMKNDNVLKNLNKNIEIAAVNLNKKGNICKFASKVINNKAVKAGITGMAGIGGILIVGLELLAAFTGGSKMLKNNHNVVNK